MKLPILELKPLGVTGDTTFKAQEPLDVDKAQYLGKDKTS